MWELNEMSSNKIQCCGEVCRIKSQLHRLLENSILSSNTLSKQTLEYRDQRYFRRNCSNRESVFKQRQREPSSSLGSQVWRQARLTASARSFQISMDIGQRPGAFRKPFILDLRNGCLVNSTIWRSSMVKGCQKKKINKITVQAHTADSGCSATPK